MVLRSFPSDIQTCTLIFEMLEYWPSEVIMRESTWVEHFQDFQNEEWDFLRIEDRPTVFKYMKTRRVKSNGSAGGEVEKQHFEEGVGFNVTIYLRRNSYFYMYASYAKHMSWHIQNRGLSC